MTRPACANPANLRHIVRPRAADPAETYCHLECLCGEIVADGNDGCNGLHLPEHGHCEHTVTPAYCLNCDTEFTPTHYDNEHCPACATEDCP